MPVRRRAWLSREGWYYCGVLAFIVGGAVLRSINLLVVLAGMMIAPLLLNWRLVMAGLWGLVVSRKLPQQICAGEPLTVEIVVENTRRRMSSWLVTVEDWVEREDRVEHENSVGNALRGVPNAGQAPKSGARSQEPGRTNRLSDAWKRLTDFVDSTQHLLRPAERGRPETVVAVIPPLEKVTSTYRLTLHRRGRYHFGPLRISTRFPLGLVWGQFTLASPAELIVAPRLGRLSPEWTRLLEAEQAGDRRRQPQRGYAEGDYYGLRPWQSGDSTRWIHWRTTAKTGVPTVLQFERQRNRDVALILDPWLPYLAHDEPHGLLELAFSLAATALADLTSRGHTRLVFAVAAGEPQIWSGPASALFCQDLLAQLAVLPASDGHSLADTIALAREQAPLGCRHIVISPRHAPADFDMAGELVWIDVGSEDLAGLFTLE